MGDLVAGLAGFALKKWERKLRPSMADDESLVDFDSGRDDSGQPVTCFASTKALYALHRGGTVLRLPYEDIQGLFAAPWHLAAVTLAGRRFDYKFARPRPHFADALREHATEAIRARADRWRAEGRLYEASFGPEKGARFVLAEDGTVTARQTGEWSDDPSEQMLFEQTWGDLEVSLGRSPSLQHAEPRPAWMPEPDWTPPLPATRQ
jgi:hypothetical protein